MVGCRSCSRGSLVVTELARVKFGGLLKELGKGKFGGGREGNRVL